MLHVKGTLYWKYYAIETHDNMCATKAKIGEKEWYFFTLRGRKYSRGLQTNRATDAGYWKNTGKDREVFQLTIICNGWNEENDGILERQSSQMRGNQLGNARVSYG